MSFKQRENKESVLDGFTIKNGYPHGISCNDSSPTITNCIIKDNFARDGGGIICSRSSPIIINCLITNNTALREGGGIYCYDSSSQITDCIIRDNQAFYSGGGISFFSSDDLVITNSLITKNLTNSYGGGIDASHSSFTMTNCIIAHNTAYEYGGGMLSYGSSSEVMNCTIVNNWSKDSGGGIYVYDRMKIINSIIWHNNPDGMAFYNENKVSITFSNIQQDPNVYPGEGNIKADPQFINYQQDNFYLEPNSPCIDIGTSNNAPSEDQIGIPRPQSLGIDIGAYEYIHATSCIPRASFIANQTTGKDSLTVEFDGSSSGGSNYPRADFIWDFGDGSMGNGKIVSHTFSEFGSYDVSLTVSTECGEQTLTLQRLINVEKTEISKNVGAGYEFSSIQEAIDSSVDGETILVHGGTYYENINFKGKAIIVQSKNGPQVTAIKSKIPVSVIIFNHGEGPDSVLDGFTIQNGSAPSYGGGIRCLGASPTVRNCIIKNNYALYSGGGIDCSDNSSLTIENSFIQGNRADEIGGGLYCSYGSSLKITNCIITNNLAERGGGIAGYNNSSITIINCTICNNKSTDEDSETGVIHFGANSSLNVHNSILWGNSPMEISPSDDPDSSITVTFSTVQQGMGIYPGNGNFNSDPLFIDDKLGNYYLSPNSPCIDKGTSIDIDILSEDPDGFIRPQGSEVDMGAYEYVDSNSCLPKAIFTASQTAGIDSLTVEFDGSLSGGSQYPGSIFLWDFGDGSTGSGQIVDHTYSKYGSYAVTLTVKTECGDHSLTLMDFVKIRSSNVTKHVRDGGSIQEVIDSAVNGEIILVHDGIYNENINFREKSIILRSENGAGHTIINGMIPGSVVTFNNREAEDSVLDGFTIQNGAFSKGGGIFCSFSSPTISNCIIKESLAYNSGGGVYCDNYSSPTITHCLITNNSAKSGGGGIYCESNSSPTIINCSIKNNKTDYSGGGLYCSTNVSLTTTNCTISDNHAESGGGISCRSSSATIDNCTISGNSSIRSGGGIYCSGDMPVIKDCTIINNLSNRDGGGIFLSYCEDFSSSPSLFNCLISNNIAYEEGGGFFARECDHKTLSIANCIIKNNKALRGGGGYCWDSPLKIINCIFDNNYATYYGGGIRIYYASPTLINCTIVNNESKIGGGGIYFSSKFTSTTITNCILWNNSPQEIYPDNLEKISVSYSDIEQDSGAYPGIGNINSNPLFVSNEQGNYYLLPDSPCRDIGDPQDTPTEDLKGIPRPQGPGIDIGAYEYVDSNSSFPRASFKADQTTGIDALTVIFDASTSAGSHHPGVNFQWDFDDGSSGTGPNIIHKYSQNGSYQVTLTITTDLASDTFTLYDLIKIKSSKATKHVGSFCEYSSIQEAIEEAEYGEIILVHNGTYEENIDFKGKTITICSENGPDATIITGNNEGNVITFNKGEGEDSILDGFTIKDGLAEDGGGIYCRLSSPKIMNCVITNNYASYEGGGIYCHSSAPTIEDSNIICNSAKSRGGGIYHNASSPIIYYSTISRNSAMTGGGIYGYRSSSTITHSAIEYNIAKYSGGGVYNNESSLTINNCTIQYNMGTGIGCENSSPIIEKCTFTHNNGSGIGCYDSSPMIRNCILDNNKIAGVFCSSASTPKIINCTVTNNGTKNGTNNRREISGGGIVCYSYSTDEADPLPTVINSILWHNDPNEISVDDPNMISVAYSNIYLDSDDIYPGIGNINSDPLFVGSQQGDFYLKSDSPCIDQGTSLDAPFDDRLGIFRLQGLGVDIGAFEYVAHDSKIPRASFKADQTKGTDSLIVEFDASSSGSSQFPGATFSWDFGDGLTGNGQITEHKYYRNGSFSVSLTITTEGLSHKLMLSDLIKIESSKVTMYVTEGDSIQEAIDNAVYGDIILVHDGIYRENINFKGKYISIYSENGEVNTIIDGNNKGSVVTIGPDGGSNVQLKGFTIQNGSAENGGGIYCIDSSPIISNCTIKNNYSEEDGGGIYCRDSSPTINNCIIFDNSSNYYGGGVYCDGSTSLTLTNCTIVNNRARYSGGSIGSYYGSGITITNCILWGNGDMYFSYPATYSNIESERSGKGNICADPLFVNPNGGDYRLQCGSPCIDAGTSEGAPHIDIDENTRPFGSGYDMGAYESFEDYSQPPSPNIDPLPDAIGEYEITLTPPMAMDNCGQIISAITDDPIIYDSSGSYLVSWIYDDGHGGVTYQTQKVIIGAPTAAFLIETDLVDGLHVQLEDKSSGRINSLICDFGDGTSIEIPPYFYQKITHTYDLPGTYTVSLKASNDAGDNVVSITVNIYPLPTGSLNGEVSDADTGAPMPDASIILWDFGQTTTDLYGNYFFDECIPEGEYRIMVSKEGYKDHVASGIRILEGKELSYDISMDTLNVFITGGVLKGDLASEPNSPIAQAKIIAMPITGEGSTWKTESDSNGAYTLFVPYGTYKILALAEGYCAQIDSNNGQGYFIDPNKLKTLATKCFFRLDPKPAGPQLRICSFEWDANTSDDIVENNTRISIFIDSNLPLHGKPEIILDPNIKYFSSNSGSLGDVKWIDEKMINGRMVQGHYEVIYSGYNENRRKTVGLLISASDETGFTKIEYPFIINKYSTKGATFNEIIPAEGGQIKAVGLIDRNRDGIVDEFDDSSIIFPPCSIVGSLEENTNSDFDDLERKFIMMERKSSQNENCITDIYSFQIMDKSGQIASDIKINQENPPTVYINFNPNKFNGDLANLIVKYRGTNSSSWSTDGIKNVRVSDKRIAFEAEHLTEFAAYYSKPLYLYEIIHNSIIYLYWVDNSENETGFEIYRKAINDQKNTLIGTTDKDEYSFQDINVINGIEYYYKVRALTPYGPTDYSNETGPVKVTTQVYEYAEYSEDVKDRGECFISSIK